MTLYSLDGIVPEIDDSAWIAPNAVVLGKVRLAAESSVWFGCTLRGDNEYIDLGAGSNLQENVVCHTDPGYPLQIGANVTVGHKAMLHGCTIGTGSLIGMGATILNGAVIGENCLIGACALITEGKEIPANSLVMGAPGKVIREMDAAAIARMHLTAAGYRANSKRFRAGLTELKS